MDFTLLDGNRFESLVEELLFAKGFEITNRPAIGPDQGCDLVAERKVRDDMGLSQHEIWLVQCKNNAKSGKSVREADIGNFELRMRQHGANRYLLVTATNPSETVKLQFQALNEDESSSRKAIFWNRQDIVRLLSEFGKIRDRYFPWSSDAKKLCEQINGDHRLFSSHRGVMAWGDSVTAVYGNDGYDPMPDEPMTPHILRTRRQVEIFLEKSQKFGIEKLAFAKSSTGATWVVLVNSTDLRRLEEMLKEAFWKAHEENFPPRNG